MDVARLYYEKDRTQNEIAEIYGISRPMVSKLLKEAKEEGIVKDVYKRQPPPPA